MGALFLKFVMSRDGKDWLTCDRVRVLYQGEQTEAAIAFGKEFDKYQPVLVDKNLAA